LLKENNQIRVFFTKKLYKKRVNLQARYTHGVFMKSHRFKLVVALLTLSIVSSCASTSTKNYACDFIQAGVNNIEIIDGRDKNGNTPKSDEKNFLLDISVGFISATGKAIKRAFTAENKPQSDKCV